MELEQVMHVVGHDDMFMQDCAREMLRPACAGVSAKLALWIWNFAWFPPFVSGIGGGELVNATAL